jgi:hypothetical protein
LDDTYNECESDAGTTMRVLHGEHTDVSRAHRTLILWQECVVDAATNTSAGIIIIIINIYLAYDAPDWTSSSLNVVVVVRRRHGQDAKLRPSM